MQKQNDTEARLSRIRGAAAPVRHNARTIAALTGNPGCGRRAVLDAAGVDKDRLAGRIGAQAGFGQSRFAIVRGNVFEAQIKANGCAELLRLLQEALGLDLSAASYADLGSAGADEAQSARHARGRAALLRTVRGMDPGEDSGEEPDAGPDHGRARTDRPETAETAPAGNGAAGAGAGAGTGAGAATLFDHPLLGLDVGGQTVFLEPDLVAVRHGGVCHVIEIKSFPVIDGQADGEKVGAAATQAAVYVLALRRMLGSAEAVSHDIVLVCPKDFSNVPTATRIDVRRQLIVLEHQLARLARIDTLLDALPSDLTFDLGPDETGAPARPAGELAAALGQLPARYAPDCLPRCELAYACRHEADGHTAALGISVREELGGVETVTEALGLAAGVATPTDDQAEAAQLLRTVARLYAELVPAAEVAPQAGSAPQTGSAPQAEIAPQTGSASETGSALAAQSALASGAGLAPAGGPGPTR